MRRLLLAALLMAPPALAQNAPPAQAQDGRAAFEAHCASCHAVTGAEALPGPNLRGLIGRRVGGDPAFDYSSVLRDAGARGDAWDAARLDRFLADPEAMYPGLWMGSNGLAGPAERQAVVRYLQSER